ncbi:TerC family protein [Ralstonia insidiosa]|uniref:TerC family protein n=1 Tax=Ralstonia insidiosa TaxID=190721 RepID=A0A848NV12_9RALS|nr:TerC family protein [Ralstonia insidiosa]NMV36354.1 TerC family protein [Ralstonia insidiosa]
MTWLADPSIWIGLFTLVVLEIVLGIDNLVFIAILVNKLPPAQRDRARMIGLGLALGMRVVLLMAMSWLIGLTKPLLTIGPVDLSGRSIILLLGGFFLLFKATSELHERLDGEPQDESHGTGHGKFWNVIAQVVILDAVFSIDSVITAVGMVNDLPVMIAAVVIAMGAMLFASRPLTNFVNAHRTVVVLCLSFLLMIGFSLVAEGLGFHIPKGYLYAAIGFSILIEFFNQVAQRNTVRYERRRPLRERTADAVLSLLGDRRGTPADTEAHETAPHADQAAPETVFRPEERSMVSGVLDLAERSVRSIMTPRHDISWVDLDADAATTRKLLLAVPHNQFPVCRGGLDDLVGVARAKDLMGDLDTRGTIDVERSVKPALKVSDNVGILRLMDLLKRARGRMLLVIDPLDVVQGVVTPIDVLEAIAGEFPDEDERLDVEQASEGCWEVAGEADLRQLEDVLHVDWLLDEGGGATSLGGYLFNQWGRLPEVGDTLVRHDLRFVILEAGSRRIVRVRIERMEEVTAPDAEA